MLTEDIHEDKYFRATRILFRISARHSDDNPYVFLSFVSQYHSFSMWLERRWRMFVISLSVRYRLVVGYRLSIDGGCASLPQAITWWRRDCLS